VGAQEAFQAASIVLGQADKLSSSTTAELQTVTTAVVSSFSACIQMPLGLAWVAAR
jgi:hypothetical protein